MAATRTNSDKNHFLVGFLWLESTTNARLYRAQQKLEESIAFLGMESQRIPAGKKLVRIGAVLRALRESATGDAFVWCNSDVVLKRNPYDVPDPEKTYGFYRTETPSGVINRGVDMYYIPVRWWDNYLSKDIPDLYIGASYVDWWISRAMEKVGAYENLTGYIDHETHGRSSAATADANAYYQRNFRNYNRWARRNGLEAIPAPPYLIPRLGHVWGLRSLIQKLLSR